METEKPAVQSASKTAAFVQSLHLCDSFAASLDPENHSSVPDDWLVAVSDVVSSRKAIAEGKYKSVNMAGVAMISAIMNALGHYDVAYAFGGDGAAVIAAPEDRQEIEKALAQTVSWASLELELELRAAIFSIKEIRKLGSDIKVSAVRISDQVNNFAFSGGGVALAEKHMKMGQNKIEPDPSLGMPDLEGLSCRWSEITPENQKVVSLIVEPLKASENRFQKIASSLIGLIKPPAPLSENPMPAEGPGFSWPPNGLELEARATHGEKSLSSQKRFLYFVTLLAWILDKTKVSIAGFSPTNYRKYTALNTDYRKVQDGLKMTLSLGKRELETVTEFLDEKKKKREIRYGMCIQDKAVLTCFVPTITSDQHFHFLDGAGGGYAQAASNMEQDEVSA